MSEKVYDKTVTDQIRDFQYVKLNPARRNLLDMISQVGNASIPATLFYDIDMTEVERERKRLDGLGQKVTVTAFLLKAIAIAQSNHPLTRTQMLPNGRLVQFNKACAQVTVERFIDDEPVLFFAQVEKPDSKSLTQINDELQASGTKPIRDLPELHLQYKFALFPQTIRQLILFFGLRLPSIRLKYMPATFGLSSLGKYGCRNLISPCVITSMFCVGELENRPYVVDNSIQIRSQLSLVLNFDHRVMDGASAARFMQELVELLTVRLGQVSNTFMPQD